MIPTNTQANQRPRNGLDSSTHLQSALVEWSAAVDVRGNQGKNALVSRT